PCEKDLADLAAAAETLGKAGVRVLALSVDGVAPGARGSREDARRVVGRLKPPFATGFADAALIDKLQLVQTKVITIPRPFPVPTAVLVDGDGLLAALYKGPLDLPKLIDDLPSLRISGERRVAVAIPFPGRRQTRGYPPFFEYMDGIAQVYAANGYPEEAEAHYRKVLRIRPGTAEAHLNLAIALAGQGKIDQAIEQYGKALEAEPENSAARNNLGFALAGQGRVEEAIVHYREAIRIEPGNVSALTNLGNALAGLGRAEEAVDLYRRAVAADPANAPARNNLALALARQGNDAEAIGMYREILKSDPENPLVRINLGIALVRLAKLSEAESELAEAVRLKPDQPEAHYHLGLVLARQRRFGEAAGRFGEAVRLKPGYGQALYYLGLCLAHQGDVEQAVSRLAEATGQPSQTGAASQRLAWVLATHPDAVFRDGAKAVRIARHLVESGGDDSFLVMDTLGAAYAEAGSFTDAIVAARRAVELADGSGEAQQAARIRERLRLYESGRAFHESAGSGR
ncbi:MAG TPA: tetratricopeptide repeat protein, partial [Candidatus Polarisedimenticolia bacterium]|nr:tetratricopeptide repeat protein [Candidatus Polarisedimenticolia bacterium]